jgi:ABC-type nitrate/sulfonate/bicarbonate transport system substrate-binding protein
VRRSRLLAAALAVAAILSASVHASAQTFQPLRISTIPFDAGSEAFYAKEQGFFAKQGLDATVNPVGNGPAIAAAVASGAIDIGFSNALSVETAYKRGLPFVFIAAAAVYSSAAPTSVLMVPKDSPAKVAKDLNGKTIAVNGLKNIAEYAPSLWIDKNGGDSSTVKFVEIGPTEIPAALEQHRIDAAFVAEPQIAQAKAASRIFAKAYDLLGDGFMIAGYFTTRQWAEAHPDLVRKFQAAMRETATWANASANTDASAEIMAKYAKLDPALVRSSVRAKFGTALSAAAIQPTIDLAAHYKLLDAFPASELIYVSK